MIQPDARREDAAADPSAGADAEQRVESPAEEDDDRFESDHPTALIGQLQTSRLAAAALVAEEERRKGLARPAGKTADGAGVACGRPAHPEGASIRHRKRPDFEETLLTRLPETPPRRRRPSQSVVVRLAGGLLLLVALGATILVLLI